MAAVEEDVQMAETDRVLVPCDGGLYASLTIDNLSAGDAHRLVRLLDWLGERDVRATFFMIPYSFQNQATLFEDGELVAVIQRGLDEGHEFLPHGFDHELFECGVPDPLAVRDEQMMNRIARTMSREMFQLVHQHTRGKIGSTLERSVRIFETALGEDHRPTGFRSGYHAFCRGLYFALEDLGIKWTSTRTAVPAAWRRQPTPDADEVVSWVGLHPYWVGDVLEVPHLCNYGYHVTPANIDLWQSLAQRHLRQCVREQAPFIAVAQYAGLRGSGDAEDCRDLGFDAYDRIVRMARDEFGCQWVTCGTIAEAALDKPKATWPNRDEYRR